MVGAPLLETMRATATISPCGRFRYRLTRTWDPSLPVMVWVLHNPSVANADRSDLTLTKCIGFARRHGCGGVVLVNLFAMWATNPHDVMLALRTGRDAKGPDNNEHIVNALGYSYDNARTILVAGWGAPAPWAKARVKVVLEMLRNIEAHGSGPQLMCFGKTKNGSPRHPSRLPYDTPLVRL